jgi:hypothetical protein
MAPAVPGTSAYRATVPSTLPRKRSHHEPVPLPDVELLEPIRPPEEGGLGGRTHVLEEGNGVRELLEEEVEIAIPVDIPELGSRHVHPSEERVRVGSPVLPDDRER